LKNYGDLRGELHLVELDRGGEAGGGGIACLGLSLAGNRDLATMSVFVVGVQPATVAATSGLVHVGDELLEVSNLTALKKCSGWWMSGWSNEQMERGM